MNEKFWCGMIIGALGGAIIVANSVKAKKAVIDGQEQVVKKIEEVTKKAPSKKTKTTAKEDN